MIDVELTWPEMLVAVEVGCRRRVESRRNGLRERHNDPDQLRSWMTEINGAAGELAFAKGLGRYWPASVNHYGGGDVGSVEVRTRSRHDYELPIRPDADDARPCALVTGVMPHFRLVGWITAGEAKRAEWLHDHGGYGDHAFFVPHSALRPIGGSS